MNMETFRKFEEQFCMSCIHELKQECDILAFYFLDSFLGKIDGLPPELMWAGDSIVCLEYEGWS